MASSITTPKGKAAYAWVTKPDTKFSESGIFKISLILPTESKACAALIEQLQEVFTDEYGMKKLKSASIPFKAEVEKDADGNEEETGNTVFSFKSQNAPRLYNAKGQPILNAGNLRIGAGSDVKINFTAKPYDKSSKCGVALYLNAVQIINLVEVKSSGMFSAEDGNFDSTGFADEEDEAPKAKAKAKAAAREEADEAEDDDIPF